MATQRGIEDPLANNILVRGPATAVCADGKQAWGLVDGRRLVHIDEAGHARDVGEVPGDSPGRLVHVHRGTVFVGGHRASLWRLKGDQLERVESFWSAPTREVWGTPWGGPPDVYSMASLADDLFVGIHVGGIIRTSDGGQSWQATIDHEVDVHQLATDETSLWAATGERALAQSTDRGKTWRFHEQGLPFTYALAAATTSQGALVSVSVQTHPPRKGTMYRFENERYLPCSGLPEDFKGGVLSRGLASRADDAVVALPEGKLYVSADGEKSWQLAADDLPDIVEVCLLEA